MIEEIVCELNGIKYLLFEIPIPLEDNSKMAKALTEIGRKYACIAQSMKVQYYGFFFPRRIMNCKILIPEKDIFSFQRDFDSALK